MIIEIDLTEEELSELELAMIVGGFDSKKSAIMFLIDSYCEGYRQKCEDEYKASHET